ncbi:P-loop containing nucleoside triphosphate hydrolase [Pseudocohnilembus persalinus]|uniref:p-loop containing nucleoside triphosphate hydrolase n=1 Tax=Pseudocohnilembus persalinus TaxID=266149 RepID=A0A0V0QTU5_PSEPJ|nr:P-loop containing nucleoside triphosphate hydrolase [Pseudocohnilembus persalinus]|eukprot:KRX05756.1 P-loop containing nucleoside triphosphate hydrolase [Pseudocohnilembus persalinus]
MASRKKSLAQNVYNKTINLINSITNLEIEQSENQQQKESLMNSDINQLKNSTYVQQSTQRVKTQPYQNRGTCPYGVILKIRGMDYQTMISNQYQPLEKLDNYNLLIKSLDDLQNEKNNKKINVSKEKIATFNRVYSQEEENDIVFRSYFQQYTKNFLSGSNQTVMIYGGANSGKSHAAFGTLRDPGFIPNLLRDIFNVYYDFPQEDQITFKLSFLNYSTELQQFTDLLTNTQIPLRVYQDELCDFHLEGVSECIVNNLKTALKLYNRDA